MENGRVTLRSKIGEEEEIKGLGLMNVGEK